MNGPSELLIRQRLRALSRVLPEARQGSASSIHQARVATRRLREALPLVAPGRQGRRLQRRVRALTRALGPVRELDVALEMLDEFDRTGNVPRGGIACLRRVIADERRRLHREMVQAVDGADIDKLARKAVAASQACDAGASSPRTGEPGERAASDQRAARRAVRLRAAIDNAAGIYLPDRLHEVRIAVKKLRYALEIAEAYRATAARGSRTALRSRAAALRTLKRGQALLGRMHDLEVLITRTRAVQGSPDAPDLRRSADLDRFVRHLEMECRQLHARYIALRPALLAICADLTARRRRRASAA